MSGVTLPHPPEEYDPQYMRDLIQRIEWYLDELSGDSRVVKTGWSVTNLTTARVVDVTGGSVTAKQNLGTLITDLIGKGQLKG